VRPGIEAATIDTLIFSRFYFLTAGWRLKYSRFDDEEIAHIISDTFRGRRQCAGGDADASGPFGNDGLLRQGKEQEPLRQSVDGTALLCPELHGIIADDVRLFKQFLTLARGYRRFDTPADSGAILGRVGSACGC